MVEKRVNISCVIPAWNEGKNIARVLKVITTYDRFDEILVIDDGSKDNTVDIVKQFQKNCKKLKLILNKQNLGKTGAIKKVISLAKGDLILMCDADLLNFTHKNIDALINPVLNKECDLTISNRAADMITITGYTNWSRLFCGERCLWKKDFEKIKIADNAGYLLEIVMDLHYINNNKKVMTVYFENLYTVLQLEKMDYWVGIRRYIKMYKNIFNAASLKDFLRLFVLVKNDRFGKLYDKYYCAELSKSFWGFLILFCQFFDGFYLFFKLNIKRIFIHLPKR